MTELKDGDVIVCPRALADPRGSEQSRAREEAGAQGNADQRFGLFCVAAGAAFLLVLLTVGLLLLNIARVPLGIRSDPVASEVRKA